MIAVNCAREKPAAPGALNSTHHVHTHHVDLPTPLLSNPSAGFPKYRPVPAQPLSNPFQPVRVAERVVLMAGADTLKKKGQNRDQGKVKREIGMFVLSW